MDSARATRRGVRADKAANGKTIHHGMMGGFGMRVTSTATIELDPRGVVITRIHDRVAQSLDHARENLAASIEACATKRCPLLVDISRCQPLEPEVRHFYSGEILVASFVALALLIEASPLGRMMGNVYFKIARPGIPTRLFTDRESAIAWLLEQVPK